MNKIINTFWEYDITYHDHFIEMYYKWDVIRNKLKKRRNKLKNILKKKGWNSITYRQYENMCNDYRYWECCVWGVQSSPKALIIQKDLRKVLGI